MKFSIGVFLLTAATGMGSTVFTNSTTTSTGSTYTVSVTQFTTTGADMAGMVVTALYSNGSSLSCTWTSAGNCSNATGGGFSASYPAANSTHPQVSNSNWTVTNNRTGFTLSSITFDGIPGLVAFDRCMTGTNTFNDTNPGGTTGTSCGTAGTAGSDIGFSVDSGASGGTTGITGTVAYTNALHLASQAVVGDWWGKFTITFSGTAFTSGSNFTFRSDSDKLASATLDVTPTPEPGTFALGGLALVGFGLMKRKTAR